MTTDFRHWPDTRWPQRWKATAAPDRLHPVTLSCHCSTNFPEPLPKVGETLYCRWHGSVKVTTVTLLTKITGIAVRMCAATNSRGAPCENHAVTGEQYCRQHSL